LIGMLQSFRRNAGDGLDRHGAAAHGAVQAEGCAPIVRAWLAHQSSSQFFQNAATIASGLRVPGPLGDLLILSMLRQDERNRADRD